jgi:hypothetical protein
MGVEPFVDFAAQRQAMEIAGKKIVLTAWPSSEIHSSDER